MNPNALPFTPKLNPAAAPFVPRSKSAAASSTATQPKEVVLDLSAQAKPAAVLDLSAQSAPSQPKENVEDWEKAAEKPIISTASEKPAEKSEEKPPEKSPAKLSPAPVKKGGAEGVAAAAATTTTTAGQQQEGEGVVMTEELKRELKEIAEAEEEDKREHVNLVFIGHVDAGKSTISGQLLYQTGQVDKRTIEKYEREAKEHNRGTWFYAYIMDTVEEERARGKTVEVGRAHFETARKRYTILDAPGHKNYVPNMISGAAQADVGILIISAKTGEFESGFEKGGQTREHAFLAKTLGLRQLIVAVNKMDEVGWSQARYDEIVGKLTPFLRKECGYAAKEAITFLPISGQLGLGLVAPVPEDVCPWYRGPSLVQTLDELRPFDRNENAPFRLPVVDRFKDLGVVHILGKIEAGQVVKGQQLVIMPNRLPVRVTGIYLREEVEVKRARAGENVRLAVQGAEESDVLTGFVVCEPTNLVKVIQEFTAQLVILDLFPSNPLFTAGYEAVLHVHTACKECVVLDLLAEMDKKTKKPTKKKPTFVKSGAIVIARLQTAAPICLELFENFPQLGRFTLRDKGKTIAIGKVVKIDDVASSPAPK